MHDFEFYVRECMQELDRLRIPYARNVRFTLNTRATSRLGLCRKSGDSYVIEIAALLLDERVDVKEGLKNTIHHELLHTCYGCMKHTGRWAQYAAKVNAAYGYRISRTAARDDGTIPQALQPEARYILKCTACGSEIRRQKRSAAVQYPQRYRCSACGGRLIRVK